MNDPHANLPTYPFGIPCFVTEAELGLLARAAAEVPAGGLILEVGGCYGGSTATLANAQPRALVLCIDEFSWSPLPSMEASAAQLLANVRGAGALNVAVLPTDSRIVGKHWRQPIDLLFVDGGHAEEFVRADLEHFGPYAQAVAMHDCGNPAWAGVERVASDFCAEHGFVVAEQSDWCVLLRRV